MSKSKNYIDQEKTILRTANNLYEHALNILTITNGVQEKQGLTSKVTEGYKAVYVYFKDSLLFSKAESAAALAHLHRQGLGVEKSEYQDKLYVSIGAKLGDQTCKDLLSQRDHKDVTPEADNWVNAIRVITKRYPNKDAEMDTADIVWAEGLLKYHCGEPVNLLYPTLPHDDDAVASTSAHNASYDTDKSTPLDQSLEMTGRESGDSSCCIIM